MAPVPLQTRSVRVPAAPPTRARHVVTTFAVALAIITYIDRVCISQAAPAMRNDLRLTAVEMGWAFSVFSWAYALFEIPGGWLGDRLGPRRVLMRVVIWWSFFTAATGWVWNFASLVVARALFGAGEAGCFPNLTRAFTTWLPARERERAQAILWLSARWGGAFTPLLVAYILDYVTWRRAFEIFGAIGIVWALAFYHWYRDDPREHPAVNEAELALLPPRSRTATVHGPIPWGRFLRRPSVWLLWMQYACLAYGWWFYITWLPTYLREARGLGLKQGALLAGLPLFLGGVGCFVSGYLAPPLARRVGGVARARQILAVTGFVCASIAVLVFIRLQDPTVAILALSTLSGSMNMMGNIAGGFSPLVVGYLLAWTANDWTLTFYVSATIYMLGGVCWLFLDSHTPVDADTRLSEI
ncbi:MAG: MFS transporter [Acidobacteria bacterium]|nr:MAG: MFS transporter [Acidobacteriota bacterium]